MTEPTDTRVVESSGDDWLTPMHADPLTSSDSPSTHPSLQRRTTLIRAGLVAAGGLVGALAVTTLHHGASQPLTPAANAGTLNGGGTQGLPGQPAAGGFAPGGRAGEQHLAGTLTAVGSSTVTVRSTAGTATYTITSNTQIVRNGALTTLSALKVGDTVFVHVYPGTSGSRLLVERLFAGSSANGGGFPGAPNGGGGGNSTGSSKTTTT
jgi:hypothetical protein